MATHDPEKLRANRQRYLRRKRVAKYGAEFADTDMRSVLATRRNFRHGWRHTPEYVCWSNIKARCLNPNAQAWKNYGGRGIRVCDRWASSFEDFLADVGSRPSPEHEIDRIDNDGHYEPGNVRWVTRSVNITNQRRRGRNERGQWAKQS